MTYLTQNWVLSQAETIITIAGPFFTKKGPDSFVLKMKFGEFTILLDSYVMIWCLWYPYNDQNYFENTIFINLNWKLYDLSFITECCKISPGIITWRLTWWKSSWVVEYNKFPRVNQHIAKSRSSGSYWDFNARTYLGITKVKHPNHNKNSNESCRYLIFCGQVIITLLKSMQIW